MCTLSSWRLDTDEARPRRVQLLGDASRMSVFQCDWAQGGVEGPAVHGAGEFSACVVEGGKAGTGQRGCKRRGECKQGSKSKACR